MLYFMMLLGGFLNHVRGGFIHEIKEYVPNWLFVSVNKVDKLIQGIVFGMIKGIILGPVIGIASAVAMWGGAQIGGWGSYIGSIFSGRKPDAEFSPIDCLIEGLEDRPYLWGFVGLSLRGGLWGLLLGLALLSWYPIIAGFLMGVVYYIVNKITGIKYAWPISEVVFGAILWGSCFI